MDSIIYKYRRLLTEGYNFANVDEVMSALEANKIGVKIQPEYKKETKWGYTCEKLRRFFNKCESLGIKDTTYGVQLLLSKVPPYNLEDIIGTDGLYELLKSRKKSWVKELKEYQTLMNSKVWNETTVNDLHTFEKVVQDSQSNHGKAAKGGGDINGVKIPYDDGTWKLMIPTSFQGEKAAAFYIKDGKETPTEWCTRADEGYYRRYTKNSPLYIIRNMKTGKSYQMAFEGGVGWNNEEYAIVHFLDQNDVKGDEITTGDLSKIPNELLKHIPIPVGKSKGKTMAEYNTDKPLPDPNAGKKGYTVSKKAGWTKEEIIDKKHQRAILKELDDYQKERGRESYFYKKYADRDIVKVVSIDAGLSTKKDPLSQYVVKGKREENKWKPKARKIKYYFLAHPESYVEIIVSKSAKITPSVNAATAYGDDRTILQYTGFHEMGLGIPSVARTKVENIGTGFKKERQEYLSKSIIKAAEQKYQTAVKEKEFENNMENYALQQLQKTLPHLKVKKFALGSFRYRVQPKREEDLDFKLFRSKTTALNSGHAPGTKWNFQIYKDQEFLAYIFVEFNKLPIKKENMKIWTDDNSHFVVSQSLKNTCFNISNYIFNSWRKQFQGEIVQNRAERNYKKNMYEEVNYFNY